MKFLAILFAIVLSSAAWATNTTAPAAATSSATAQATASGTGTGGNANVDAGRWGMYILPAPVFTPPLAAIACPAGSAANEAYGIGWNFISIAKGRSDASDCTLLTIRNAKIDQCQYASAKQIEDLLTAKYLPTFQTSTVAMLDLTPTECAALKAPPKPPPQITLAAQACPAPAPQAKPPKKPLPPPKPCTHRR